MERRSIGSVPNASKQYRSVNLGSPGPLFGKTTRKALNANHVWVGGSTRAQASWSTSDVLREFPSEKSRGLRGDPAQKQRAEMGRIIIGVVVKVNGIGRLLHRTWACDTGGSKRERKHLITPDDARERIRFQNADTVD